LYGAALAIGVGGLVMNAMLADDPDVGAGEVFRAAALLALGLTAVFAVLSLFLRRRPREDPERDRS
jgi:hypothetical protein